MTARRHRCVTIARDRIIHGFRWRCIHCGDFWRSPPERDDPCPGEA